MENYFASNDSFRYTYAYDRNSQVLQIEDHVHQNLTQRTYDAYGNMQAETLGNSLQMKYAYDSVGRTTRCTLPDNSHIDYVYEAAFLKEIHRSVKGTDQYVHRYTGYDKSGVVTGMKLPKSAGQVAYTYDLKQRPLQIKSKAWTQSEIKYDRIGNLAQYQLKDSQGSVSYQFAYDDLYQLTSESGTATHAYRYDSLNNRVTKDSLDHLHNYLNQLLSDGHSEYTYDSNGNLESKTSGSQSVTYSYDALDRLIKVEDGINVTTYQYDAFNRRLSKTSNGVTTRYLYRGQDEIGAVENGEIVELRVLGNGKGAEIGAAVALEICGKTYVPLHDHNGNVVTILDTSGNVVETYRYTAYGEEQIFDAAGNPLEASSIGNSWRFSSKRFDAETGFIYFGRRYYASEIGRWVTSDPIGFDDGPNLYAYVHNNPLNYVDLYGLKAGDGYRACCEVARHANEYVRDRERDGIQQDRDFTPQEEQYSSYEIYTAEFVKALPNSIFSALYEDNEFSWIKNPTCQAMLIGAIFLAGQSSNPISGTIRAARLCYTAGRAFSRAHQSAMSAIRSRAIETIKKNGNRVQSAFQAEAKNIEKVATKVKQGSRNKFSPDPIATGAHTVFRRDPISDIIEHYETYIPQTNYRNPNPWESILRYDGPGRINQSHYNKATKEFIDTPHVHDSSVPGGIRKPEIWEIPQ